MTHADVIRSAEEGRTAGEIALGHCYLIGKDWDGNPLPIDYAAARHWLERAAAKGAGTAVFLLGTIYDEGLGVSADSSQAIAHFTRAAERGSFLACIHLARVYARPNTVAHSKGDALLWYDRALQLTEEDEIDLPEEIAEARSYVDAAG